MEMAQEKKIFYENQWKHLSRDSLAKMASPTRLESLLELLSQSLHSAIEATPKIAGTGPPENGLSLLDVKNDLLLSYLQNLVFLIVLKIRNAKDGTSPSENEGCTGLRDAVVRKLVELRLFIEKGVRPLEDKLRYQIEKALRAAEDEERKASANINKAGDQESDSHSDSGSQSEEEDDSGEETDGEGQVGRLDPSRALPNRAAFLQPSAGPEAPEKSSNGVYRPPRIAPTVMPTTERSEKAGRKPLKSATMDEYIAAELSSAPVVQPSIGTNIRARGRHLKTESERKAEQDRTDYEERNFVRLPSESKKDRTKRSKAEGRNGRLNFGGEEWRGLGEGADRINRLTKSKGAGGGAKALLEKSRKRGLDTTDGPRGSGSGGAEIGERYKKRLKVQSRGERGGKRSR